MRLAAADHARDDVGPLLRWLGEQPTPPAVELVCAGHPDPARGRPGVTVIRLPGCAAGLTAASYLEVVAGRVAALAVRVDGCPAAAAVSATVAGANRLLAACPGVPRTACVDGPGGRARRPVHDLRRLPVSRRRLLGLRVAEPGARFVPSPRADQRSRTLAALDALLGAARLGPGRLGTALAPPETPAAPAAPTAPAAPAAAATPVAVLPAPAARRCARCGDEFAGPAGQDRCPVCAFRRASPFGLRVPAA